MSEVQGIWDQAAGFYDQIYANNVIYHRSHDVVVDLLPKGRDIHVLDLGAGTGLLAERILQRVPGTAVTCLDLSSPMLDQAKQRLAPFGARAGFTLGDIRSWTAPRAYDAIVTCNALVYRELPVPQCYARVASALLPGGLLVNSTVVKHPEPAMWKRLLGNLGRSDAPGPSERVRAFARGPGRRVAHFGEDSLAAAFTVQEHLDFMAAAGLDADCVWEYFSQAVLVGVRA